MGLFSKFKKKLTKGLRKITPKEIAPILPFLAMAVPGMGGIMGSSMAKFLVPQLLTAAGSARTSGKISGINQLLAAGSSLAGIDAANKAAATSNMPISRTAALEAQKAGTALPTYSPAPKGILDTAATQVGKIPGVSKFAEGQKNLASLMPGGDPATFSMSMLAPISAGTTAAGIDQATLAQIKADAEAEYNATNAQGYRDASAAVAAAIARFSDPLNQYGNNPFMANQGGRVGYKDGDLVSKIYGKAKPGYGLSKKLTIPLAGGVGLGGYGLLSLIDAVRAATGMADGGRIGYNNGSSPMGVQGLSSMMAPLLPNIQVNDDDLTRELFSEMMGAQTSDNDEGIPISLLNSMAEEQAKAKRKRDRELMSYFGMNQGGRIGMNMGGGLGSIPQTPTVPQGMQLDGRGGGFIPMGAQERKDDVPAMLAKNEFVMTADAVRAAGGGSIEKGAQKMYDVMNQLESQV